MNKELFIAVCDRLKSGVPALQWVDADEGQLNSTKRPPVAFPCCLVDMSYPQCENHMAGSQRIRVLFTLRVAFLACATANAGAPTAVREQALRRLDVLQDIHKTLQWWNFNRQINPMRRVSVGPERSNHGMKVYTMTYESAFMD